MTIDKKVLGTEEKNTLDNNLFNYILLEDVLPLDMTNLQKDFLHIFRAQFLYKMTIYKQQGFDVGEYDEIEKYVKEFRQVPEYLCSGRYVEIRKVGR